MQHLYWILPDQLAGRCGPEKVPWEPAALYAAGIRTVLTVAREERVADLSPYGLRHQRLALPPLPFLLRHTQRAFARLARPVLDFIAAELSAERPVLVHCHDGDDRAGVILSGYLVVYEGLAPEAAVARVRAMNPRAMKMPGYAGVARWFRTAT